MGKKYLNSAVGNLNYMSPKNCIQILKGLNKNNYIILLAYRMYVLWCIILLSMKIKETFKICVQFLGCIDMVDVIVMLAASKNH